MLDGLAHAPPHLCSTRRSPSSSPRRARTRASRFPNLSYAALGELTREMDPYFRAVENAPEVWGDASFAAMGITYRDTKMRLDLCDRG